MQMKTLFFFTLLGITFIHPSLAQSDSTSSGSYRYNNYFDLATSFGKNEFASAIGWSHFHKLGKQQRFAIGYGLRYTGYWGGNKLYRTAPAKWTSTRQDPLTIFSDDVNENLDTLSIISPQVNSLNISLHLQYALLQKLEVGMNIDLVGYSFGDAVRTYVMSSSFDDGQPPVINAKPTKINLLLTSDNDIGSLNSEFYVRFWFHKKWAIRGGYTFYFSEYTTDKKLSFDKGRVQNDRYRLKSGLFLVGLAFTPFTK